MREQAALLVMKKLEMSMVHQTLQGQQRFWAVLIWTKETEKEIGAQTHIPMTLTPINAQRAPILTEDVMRLLGQMLQ